MLLMLCHICSENKIEMTLTAEEVCELLNINPSVLENCRKRKWIKGWTVDKRQYYKAYDLAKLAERINRRKLLRKLSNIPIIRQ